MNRFFLKSLVREKITGNKGYITKEEKDEIRDRVLNFDFSISNEDTKNKVDNIIDGKTK